MTSFWTGFEKKAGLEHAATVKTAKTRFAKELAKAPKKFESIFSEIPHGSSVPNLPVRVYGSDSGLPDFHKRRMFHSLKDSVSLRDLSYRNPLKRAATKKMPDGTFRQLDMHVPRKHHELPADGPIYKRRLGIAEKKFLDEDTGTQHLNNQKNVAHHINEAAKLLHLKSPDAAYRVIGSKKHIDMTHISPNGGAGILDNSLYNSIHGGLDMGKHDAVFAHATNDAHWNGSVRWSRGKTLKIHASVPESRIIYRPNTTPGSSAPEAIVSKEEFKKHIKKVVEKSEPAPAAKAPEQAAAPTLKVVPKPLSHLAHHRKHIAAATGVGALGVSGAMMLRKHHAKKKSAA